MVIAVALAFVYLGFTVGLSNFYQVPFLTSVSDNDRGNNRNHLRRRQLSSSKNSDYVLFQKCKDSGEAYSASYLITREHLEYQFTDYNLTWVNCEMGSFIMMNGRANPDKNINGSIVQSVDVLDLSVIHLSTYERLLRRWAHSVRSDPSAKAGNIASVVASAKMLRERALILRGPDIPMEHPAYNRTVVIMPFLGSDMGAGHSKLSNRLQYLSACFWSFYAVYPHVVAAVKNEKDREFARLVVDLFVQVCQLCNCYLLHHYSLHRTTSGLPFFDVMLLPDLPKSASLPVGTVQETKRRIVNGSWSDMFDYVFFTESDQVRVIDAFSLWIHCSFPFALCSDPDDATAARDVRLSRQIPPPPDGTAQTHGIPCTDPDHAPQAGSEH